MYRKLSLTLVPLNMSETFSLNTLTPVNPSLVKLLLLNVFTVDPWIDGK